MTTDIDEQIAKAKAKVKRLEQRKILADAKKANAEYDKLVKQVEELKSKLASKKSDNHDLEIANDSIKWTKNAIQNLIDDIREKRLGNWSGTEKNNDGRDVKIPLSKSSVIIERLNGILKGQQPTKKK